MRNRLVFTDKRMVLMGFLILSLGKISVGQSLDNFTEQKPLLLNGFVSTNQILTSQSTDSTNNFTYTGVYTGSLIFNVYGVSVPLTFIYSNNQSNFSHPFNQYGMHPSYKWVKGHIGYASMSFSPYTLSGHLFLGAGAEIDPPGPVRASVMYGRLKKAVEYDSSNTSQVEAYKRMGYGIKVGLAKKSDYIDLVLFGASDQINSIDSIPDTSEILPQENMAFSISAGKTIAKNLSVTAEYANSYLTSDTRAEYSDESKSFLQPATWLMSSRLTSTSREAMKLNLNYKPNRWSMGLGYEKVDPDYATLGAYYFTNNMENLTINFGVNFFNNKLAFNGTGGLQRDNLDNSKLNNNKRYVGSGSINATPSERLNLNLAYSNFLSYTNVRSTFDYINESTPYENWDTLDYRQISQNTNLNASYQLKENEKRRQSLSSNLTYQISDSQQSDEETEKSRFYNANISYSIAFTPTNFNISSSINYNRNEVTDATTQTFGPSVSLSKSFLEKTLRSSLTLAYNTSTSNGVSSGDIYNIRLGQSYAIKKKHNFNLNLLYQFRNLSSGRYNTYTVTLGYVYNFNLIGQRESNQKTNSN